MKNQDILNALSNIECELFYRYSGGANRESISYEDLCNLHSEVDSLLHKFHNITGLSIT